MLHTYDTGRHTAFMCMSAQTHTFLSMDTIYSTCQLGGVGTQCTHKNSVRREHTQNCKLTLMQTHIYLLHNLLATYKTST